MLRTVASAIALSAGLVVVGCNDKSKNATEVYENARPTTTAGAVSAKGGNDQAITTLTALNQGEVDQANAALPKLANDEAKKFADMMAKHHSEAIAKLSTIANDEHIVMTDNMTSRDLKTQSAQLVGKMSTMTAGPDFDRMYMQAQVDGHQKALRIIDNDVMPNIDNASLKSAVTDMRATVMQHLSTAQTTLQGMPSS
jgi:putative membrane protein